MLAQLVFCIVTCLQSSLAAALMQGLCNNNFYNLDLCLAIAKLIFSYFTCVLD